MFRKLAVGALASLVIALVVGAGVNAARWDDARALTNCETSSGALNSAEQRLVDLINEYRVANGRVALVVSPSLSRASAWMAEDLLRTGRFSHSDSLNRDPFVRGVQCGYSTQNTGENLVGSGNPDTALRMWMGSPAHNANLLHPSWRAIGVGVAGNIFAANFGPVVESGQTLNPATSTPTPSPTPTPTKPPIVRRAALQMVSTD